MYTPSKKVLENYSRVMVDFALGRGKGIKKGEVVYLQYDAEAQPLALEVFKRILEKGAYPMLKSNEEAFEKIMFEVADDDQLSFFPKKYTKTLIDTIDHRLYLIATRNPFLLKNVDPKKIVKANVQKHAIRKWLFEKEDKGKLTWSLCLYGTEGMAREAGLTLEEFWQEIINACYLDESDPITTWKNTYIQLNNLLNKMNKLPIDKLHITSEKTDLWIKMGEKRQWLGARGANIPSFEIFTSPDWRGYEGHVYFDFPLYRYGNVIEKIYFEFKNGIIVKAKAEKNEKLLQTLVNQKNANKIGEYSLTDKRFSRIKRFTANTLYDENFGGEYGNSHLAFGTSYHDAYSGDIKNMTKADWDRLGFNESIEHLDVINTKPKTVEATMNDGSKKIIYKNGIFVI
jgi:aminopeptidase